MKTTSERHYISADPTEPVDSFTCQEAYTGTETRTCEQLPQQLVPGVSLHESERKTSDVQEDSVERRRGHRKRGARSMGCRPFVTACNNLLRETEPYYAESTHAERKRKFRRVGEILTDLKAHGRISTTSPKKLTESDIGEFVRWLKENVDATTGAHYLKFLDEILQSVGNNVVTRLKVKRRNLLPKVSAKSIRTIPADSLEVLLSGDYCLDDNWWNSVGRTAITLCSHSGLRPSELRLAKLKDLDLSRMEITVSCPKGMKRWTNGTEASPVMNGCELALEAYLKKRDEMLREAGIDEHEALFPFRSQNGKVGYWSSAMWSKLKCQLELASGIRFRWKDFRPTFAQKCKDGGANIESVSKAMRHKDTKTTEAYYARIRSESAFSDVRAAWQVRKSLPQPIAIPSD